jgi:Zn-finger nucleic acid-binding protein
MEAVEYARMIRMVDRQQAHIWFESCPICYGNFLDAGEFRDLTSHTVADIFRRLRKGERPLT